MRILHVAYSLGESSAATRLARSQAGRHEVFFLLGRLSRCEFVRNRQLCAVPASAMGVGLHVLEMLLYRACKIATQEVFSFGFTALPQNQLLKKLLRGNDFDVVHLHWGGYSFFPLRAAAGIPLPLVVTAHDYHLFTGGCHVPMECQEFLRSCHPCPLTGSALAQKYVRYAKSRNEEDLQRLRPVVTAPSTYTEARIKERFPFLATKVIGNALREEFYGSLGAPRIMYSGKRGSLASPPTIITVGTARSTRQNKGQDILEQVLAGLSRAGVRFNYISVGKYDEYPGIENRSHYDSLSARELRDLYSVSDLCLVPSRYETFSQVALESILCGTPVIAFDNSGPRDIVMDGVTGFLVPSFDQEGFLRAVKEQLDFKFNKLDTVFRGVLETARRFSPDAICDAFDSAYSRAGAGR